MDFSHLKREAELFAFRELAKPSDLATYLRGHLGRPVVARLTGIADANNVTRWATGKAKPEKLNVQRMRIAAQLHFILARLFRSDDSAADWFTGNNEFLNFTMPVEAIENDDAEAVFKAAKAIAAVSVEPVSKARSAVMAIS